MNGFRKKTILGLWFGLLAIALGIGGLYYWSVVDSGSFSSNELKAPEPPPAGTWLENREKQFDQTLWAKEKLAEECGRTIEIFWDSLKASTNKLEAAAGFPAAEFVLGAYGQSQVLAHDICRFDPAGTGLSLSTAQWRQWVQAWQQDGWELEQVEFRHTRFETDQAGQPWHSQFYFTAHLDQPKLSRRAQVEGNLVVHWKAKSSPRQEPGILKVDASHLVCLIRKGEPAFQPILMDTVNPPAHSTYVDPLILYDLNGDGVSEIILAAMNRVYRRRGPQRYEAEALCTHSPGLITTAVIADFDGDGVPDLLGAKSEGLILFKGSTGGAFPEPGRLVWRASSSLPNAMVITCGDIDHDRDLDVFIGQYRVPTFAQVLQPAYFDANDGYPFYLLLNDGLGTFTDVTPSALPGSKRWRRVYSSSLADLNQDAHLDLAVVSDFAGMDLYQNDGAGHFKDVTSLWIRDAKAFGMAHALADFNVDGLIDLLMIGMPSPAVDRLEFLGLRRLTHGEDPSMRSRMSYGNRLYLGQAGGGFAQTSLNDSLARSGWSWGCSAFDFDNDRYPDVYIANGLESRRSVQDYEAEFWMHDIHVDLTVDDREAAAYFMNKFSRTRGQGWSYGGYEKNRLYLNQAGRSFQDIAWLMGVAFQVDCRNVVTDDLDGDGRLDLILTTLEYWPESKQTLRVYSNNLPDHGNWIGFRLREEGKISPVGARILIEADGKKTVREILTGDSHRSQHASQVHFGLGSAQKVDRVEVNWINGEKLVLTHPTINRYHWVYGHSHSAPILSSQP